MGSTETRLHVDLLGPCVSIPGFRSVQVNREDVLTNVAPSALQKFHRWAGVQASGGQQRLTKSLKLLKEHVKRV